MTQKSKEQIEYTLDTDFIEKLVPSEEALHLCEQMTKGTVSADEAVSVLLGQYGLQPVRANG